MKIWFEALRSWTGSRGVLGFMSDLRRINVIQGHFELAPSKDTPGLQLIDIVLWLYRRSISDHLRGFPKATTLLDWIVDQATLLRFSSDQLRERAEEHFAELAGIPDSQLDHENGPRFAKQLEQIRLRRMGIDIRRV